MTEALAELQNSPTLRSLAHRRARIQKQVDQLNEELGQLDTAMTEVRQLISEAVVWRTKLREQQAAPAPPPPLVSVPTKSVTPAPTKPAASRLRKTVTPEIEKRDARVLNTVRVLRLRGESVTSAKVALLTGIHKHLVYAALDNMEQTGVVERDRQTGEITLLQTKAA